MKKYVNQSNEMRIITFTDGTSTFLFRGQAIETDKEVKSMNKGIKEKNVSSSPKRKASKKEDVDAEGNE